MLGAGRIVSARGTAGAAAIAAAVAAPMGCGTTYPDTSDRPATGGRSMFTASYLSKALTKVRTKLGDRTLKWVTINPRNVDAHALGFEVVVDVNGNSETSSYGSNTTRNTLFNLSVISPAAVEKAVKGVESRNHLLELDIGYVRVEAYGTQRRPSLTVYPRSGSKYWTADLSGNNIQGSGT